jgi:hypothetical protein
LKRQREKDKKKAQKLKESWDVCGEYWEDIMREYFSYDKLANKENKEAKDKF